MKNEYKLLGEIKIIVEGNNNGTLRFKTDASCASGKEELITILNEEINKMIEILCDAAENYQDLSTTIQ